jgi:predicted acyl esterase
MVPMRDGKRLHTKIFTPRPDRPLPIIFKRTPYGIQGSAETSTRITRRSAERLHLRPPGHPREVRSEGDFVMQRPAAQPGDTKSIDEGTDTYDTIDWLIKNVRNNNGRVGMLGVSYDGWTTIMGAIEPHPRSKAISPQASPPTCGSATTSITTARSA